MKNIGAVGLAIAMALGMAANAAESQKFTVDTTKEQPYSVFVRSGQELVAELKILKTGTVNLDGGTISVTPTPSGGKAFSCSGGSKLEVVVDGKPALTLSADSMLIQVVKPDPKRSAQ